MTAQIDLRAGGAWGFDMIGPDGTVWANRYPHTVWQPERRIRFLMDDGTDAAPPVEVVVTLADATIRAVVKGFGAVDPGQTTLAKLAHLAVSP